MKRPSNARGSILTGLLALCFGCGSGDAYFPLEENREWKYLVSTPAGSSVARLRVIERVRVGLTTGWKIEGNSGESRMAWSGGQLLVSDFSAMRFEPPIAILKPNEIEATWQWKGRTSSRGAHAAAQATGSQKRDRINLAGAERDCLLSVITLTFRDSKLELRTWFQSGIGIVRQEQHFDGRLSAALEWIGGS